MRRLSPSYVVTSVAIALASTTALAQLRIQAAPAAGTTATTTAGSTSPQAGTTTSGPSVTAGGCTGTGGSTCTATTTSTTTSGSASGNAVPSETAPATAGGTVTTSGTGSATTPAASSGATASQPFTPDFVNNDAATAPFRTTPNTPDAMPTGAALGQSPGQTSSGTAAGNSSGGIDAGSQNLGTVNPSGNNLGNTALVPGATVGATTGYVGAAPAVNANGERIGNGSGGVAANTATTPTPIFELAAREGAAREARRRARGEEPRVYGIAPRTDRDLTHQMPDDPVIRY